MGGGMECWQCSQLPERFIWYISLNLACLAHKAYAARPSAPRSPLSPCPMCSPNSSSWCGVPPTPPRPLRCGVLIYLHVPKTGGSAVTQFLHSRATGGRGWEFATVTREAQWPAILAALRRRQHRPKQIVVHHVDASVSLSNETLERNYLAPLDCWLRSQGCRLVRTATLREAAARATSAAFYNRVAHDQYSSWVREHASNGITSFLLHNRLRLRRHNRTVPMSQQSLHSAQTFLSGFDAVGRTEELSVFLTYLDGLLLANSSRSGDTANRIRENETPERYKFELSATEQMWTRQHSALDQQLYNSFCTSSSNRQRDCPLRRVVRQC